MPLSIPQGQPITLPIVWPSDPLAPHDKTLADAVNCTVNLKRDTATDDDDAYLERTLDGGGVTIDAPAATITLTLAAGETTALGVGTYELVVAVDPGTDTGQPVAGDIPWIELGIDDPMICIVEDKNRR